MAQVPHFAFPLRLGAGGSLAVVEQDGADDIAQCVRVLASTQQGERIELPGYGIEDPTFRTDIDLNGVRQAVEEWEPRAAVLLSEEPDRFDDMVRRIRMDVAGPT